MWNFNGIVYRIWAVAGLIILLGVACLLISKIGKKDFNKECCSVGILCTLGGIAFAIYYASCVFSQQVSSFQGTFYETYRNSRVAPPLPFTMEYRFYDANDTSQVFYLDIFSMKEMIPEDFVLGKEYTIYYETNTNVIVGAKEVTR